MLISTRAGEFKQYKPILHEYGSVAVAAFGLDAAVPSPVLTAGIGTQPCSQSSSRLRAQTSPREAFYLDMEEPSSAQGPSSSRLGAEAWALALGLPGCHLLGSLDQLPFGSNEDRRGSKPKLSCL